MIGQNDGYNCVNQDGCRYPGGCGLGGCKDTDKVRYLEPYYIARIENKLERIEKLLFILNEKYKDAK